MKETVNSLFSQTHTRMQKNYDGSNEKQTETLYLLTEYV